MKGLDRSAAFVLCCLSDLWAQLPTARWPTRVRDIWDGLGFPISFVGTANLLRLTGLVIPRSA